MKKALVLWRTVVINSIFQQRNHRFNIKGRRKNKGRWKKGNITTA